MTIIMLKQFSSIMELKSIKELKSQLTKREAELSVPLLTDMSIIPQIYDWFKEIMSELNLPPNPESVSQRKKFLFIILLIFAPEVLAGGRMPNGIRSELAKLFPKISPYTISHNISDISFLYKHYKDFRQDIEYAFNGIICKLGLNFNS